MTDRATPIATPSAVANPATCVTVLVERRNVEDFVSRLSIKMSSPSATATVLTDSTTAACSPNPPIAPAADIAAGACRIATAAAPATFSDARRDLLSIEKLVFNLNFDCR